MSQSNDEFLGRLSWLTRIRQLETRLDRLERHPSGEAPSVAIGESTQGEATMLQGTPGLRHSNVTHVGGFPAAAEARPRSLVPTDPQGNIDYRRSGGIVYSNRTVSGYGDNTAILDGVDSTYRFWLGASAAASAPFRITQAGAMEIGAGASVATLTVSPSPGVTVIDISSSGATVLGVTSASSNLAGFLVSELTSKRWLAYYNTIAGCSNQFDFYSYNTDAAVLSLGFAAGSSRFNTALALFDGSGGSQILDAAGSGVRARKHLRVDKGFLVTNGTIGTLTISSGCITVTTNAHLVDTEGSSACDNLDTILGGSTGMFLTLQSVSADRRVILRNAQDNTRLSGSYDMDSPNDTITLFHNGTNWLEIARTNASTSDAAAARIFYISANGDGDDNNSGTLTASPWATVDKVNNLTSACMLPGDTYAFQGRFFESACPPVSGCAGCPILWTTYGTGASLDGRTEITTWSTTSSANVYSKTHTSASSTGMMCFYNGSRLRWAGSAAQTPTASNFFQLDDTNNTLYVWLPNSANPNAAGASTYFTRTSVMRGFQMNSKQYISVCGFTVTGWAQHGISAITASNRNINVSNVLADHNGVQGFRVYTPSTACEGSLDWVIDSCSAVWGCGEGFWLSASNIKLSNFVARDNGFANGSFAGSNQIAGQAMFGVRSTNCCMVGGSIYYTDRANTVIDNTVGSTLTVNANSQVNIEWEAATPVQPTNCEIRNVHAWAPSAIQTVRNYGASTVFMNCIFENDTANNIVLFSSPATATKFYHCAFYLPQAAILFSNSVDDFVETYNNVLISASTSGGRHYSLDTAAEAGMTAVNNFYYGGQGSPFRVNSLDQPFSYWTGTLSNDTSGCSVQPSASWFMVSPSSHDFTPTASFYGLQRASVLAAVTTDILGNVRSSTSPDVGPYEV